MSVVEEADVIQTSAEAATILKKAVRSTVRGEPFQWSHNKYHATPHEKFEPTTAYNDILQVPTIDARTVSEDEFMKKYGRPRKPVLIKHGMTAWDWKAAEIWKVPQMLERFQNSTFDVGGASHEYINFKHYLEYCAKGEGLTDDSPMYIFEPNFADKYPSLVQDYTVPPYFTTDLMEYMRVGSEWEVKTRPYFRWLLIGPPRSGTFIHQDPIGTSAWNALLAGRKRWCIFPPNTDEDLLKTGARAERFDGLAGGIFGVRSDSDNDEEGKETMGQQLSKTVEPVKLYHDSGMAWFQEIYPKLLQDSKVRTKMIEFVQEAGDVIYVPNKWWHVVCNIPFEHPKPLDASMCTPETQQLLKEIDPDDQLAHLTISVTANFVPSFGCDFADAFDDALTSKPHTAFLWHRQLESLGKAKSKQLKEARLALSAVIVENINIPQLDYKTITQVTLTEYDARFGAVFRDPSLQGKINVMKNIADSVDEKQWPRWKMILTLCKALHETNEANEALKKQAKETAKATKQLEKELLSI